MIRISNFEFRICALASFLFLVTLSAPAFSAEITSNGSGGGPWTDPSTWHGGQVPTAQDSAVIARDDTVAFDRDDDAAITCKELYLDPKGTLTFKHGGKRTLVVGGVVESYGMIQMDDSGNPDDLFELRLAGPKVDDRVIRLLKGSSLIVSGAPDLPGQKHNVVLASVAPLLDPKAAPGDPSGSVQAGSASMVDVRQADVRDVQVQGTSIDNTGAKPDERFNLSGNRFTGQARVVLNSCDTPAITDNAFIWAGPGANGNPAIYVANTPLPGIQHNTFKGNRERAISGAACTDATIENNLIEGPYYGVVWAGDNAAFRGNTLRDCSVGIYLQGNGAAVEDSTIDGAKIAGIQLPSGGTLQLTSTLITNLAKGAVALDLSGNAQVDVLNCNVTPEKVHVAKAAHNNEKNVPTYWAQGQDYVVIHVKGRVPAQTQVDMLTANPAKPLPPGAMDMNIRNAPADLYNGWTPVPQPQGLPALIVRTWCIEGDGHATPSPTYTLQVLGPAPKADAPQPVLKSLTLRPTDTWFRPRPNDQVATVEVTLP